MRTIKFRGKDIETGEWIVGDLIQRLGRFPSILFPYEYNGKVHYAECAVDRNTVGQFTGLKDKNGVEIYPNDIISSLDGRFIGYVVDSVRAYCYDVVWIKHPSDEKRWSLWGVVEIDNNGNIEVIGNTYDNPELINGKEQQ